MRLLAAAVVPLALLAGCSAPAGLPVAPAGISVRPQTTQPAEPEPTERTFTTSDFVIKLKITKKQCFGSAGCNVTFKASVVYAGEGEVDDLPEGTISVTYAVKGAEDPYTSTIDVEDGRASADTAFVSTRRSRDKLTAKVTEVEYDGE